MTQFLPYPPRGFRTLIVSHFKCLKLLRRDGGSRPFQSVLTFHICSQKCQNCLTFLCRAAVLLPAKSSAFIVGLEEIQKCIFWASQLYILFGLRVRFLQATDVRAKMCYRHEQQMSRNLIKRDFYQIAVEHAALQPPSAITTIYACRWVCKKYLEMRKFHHAC